MYYIAKLFNAFFLPPGIFVIILFLAAIYSKKAKTLFFLSALLLWGISTKFVSNLLVYPLESGYKLDNISPQAVVVLGGGVNPHDVLKAMPDAFKREVYAILIAKKYNLPLVFSGGGRKINESANVRNDIKTITSVCGCKLTTYFETKSLNTYQNAEFSALLFKKLHLTKNIYLVTSAYHMKRALMMFRRFGFKVIPKPVGFYYNPNYKFLDILPHEGFLNISYKALHEYVGILYFKIKTLL